MSDGEPLIKMRHIRAAGHCASGTLEWLDAHGIERRRLMAGIPASEFEATGDAQGIEVARIARRDADGAA